MAANPQVRPRRTQAERSARTRSRLLDATLSCLIKNGYRGTTTTAVANLAGVSRGAELHHFPSRAQLVSAAVEHLFAQLTAQYQHGFAELTASANRVEAALELLWSTFEGPRFACILELYIAARTEAELRTELEPVAERHRHKVVQLAREYFPESGALAELFDTTLCLILDAMHGMALSRAVFGSLDQEPAELAMLKEIAARLIYGNRAASASQSTGSKGDCTA